LRQGVQALQPTTWDVFNLHVIFSGGELRDWVPGMGRAFGDDRIFGEDQTQRNSYKQCDILLPGPQFCRSDYKFSA
jgi:hypothetical protein